MVDEVMDSVNETSTVVEPMDALPEVAPVEAAAAVEAAPADPVVPVKVRKVQAKAAKPVEAPVKPVMAAAEPVKKAKAPKPDDYKIVGEMLTYDPYAFIVRQNDSVFLDFVNAQIIEMIKDGRYMTIYEKWFGPKGALPMPMTDEFKTLLKLQAWPS